MSTNSASSDSFEGTFHPILPKSGFWICVQYTQTSSVAVDIRIWESSNYSSEQLRSLHFLGLALKALHLAQGGNPAQAEGLTSIMPPVSIPLPNGVLHSTTVRPTGEKASHQTIEAAWPFLFCDLSAATGMMGSVQDELTADGYHQLTVEFGPAVLLRPAVLPPEVSFKTVELSATLSSTISLRPGG